MSLKVKLNGSYVDTKQVFVKKLGTYQAVNDIFTKTNGIYNTIFNKITVNILQVLAKYGTGSHLYIPGVGSIDGIAANNWINPAGTQSASLDSAIAKVTDATGNTINAEQYFESNRPVLKHINGKYAWLLNGSYQYFKLSSVPFQLTDDFCVVAGVNLLASGTERAIFAQSNMSNHALPEFMFNAAGKLGIYAYGGGTIVNTFAGPNNAGAVPIVASAISRSSNIKVRRNAVEITTATLSGTYTTATTSAIGAFPTLSIAEALNGYIYPTVVINGTVSDTDLVEIEKFIASCSDVIL